MPYVKEAILCVTICEFDADSAANKPHPVNHVICHV